MKRLFLWIILFSAMINSFPNSGKLFNTSVCFDLLCSIQYFEQLKSVPQFEPLLSDSTFVKSLRKVNDNCKASQLCNLYNALEGDKESAECCLKLFADLKTAVKDHKEMEWASHLVAMHTELYYVLQSLVKVGYPQYWTDSVAPRLQAAIDNYQVDEAVISAINSELSDFSGHEALPEVRSNIYILDIGNAFNLSDESFCCTPLILDPEMEKRLHLSFLHIYIHENLHRLYISETLMDRIRQLSQEDEFYRAQEAIAGKYNEGRNEAFVLASEVYISKKLGLRDSQSVMEELSTYVDGSLVLAPIIYVNFKNRHPQESLNDYILRLFDEEIIKPGSVERAYNKAMAIIRSEAGI